MRTYRDAKPMAKSLRNELAQRNIPLTHGDCLEIVARQFGLPDWNVLSARLSASAHPDAGQLPLPEGWHVTGHAVNGVTHRLGRDPAQPGVALIESLLEQGEGEDLTDQIAVLMQTISAERYRGDLVELCGDLATEAAGSGTLWMRVDAGRGETLRFDNMMERPQDGALRGTQDWSMRRIVLDVPPEARTLHYGMLLKGYGQLRVRNVDLRVPGEGATPTSRTGPHPQRPTNLGFEVGNGV